MPIPDARTDGTLPPGIHAASLAEVVARFGAGSAARERQAELLRQVVAAAGEYATIKRVLVWGSFVTEKAEPNDLDYSVIVSIGHHRAFIDPAHRRFLVPVEARQFYGTDRNYLVIKDYPIEEYAERLDFACRDRRKSPVGILEISLRGEMGENVV